MATGGLILWVTTPDPPAEHRALEILTACGATSCHIHSIDRTWGVADVPLHALQPDPFLADDPPSTDPGAAAP